MSHSRRTRLARQLAARDHISYQAALARLESLTATGQPLPRDLADLPAAGADAPTSPRSPEDGDAGQLLAAITALLGELTPGTAVRSTWPDGGQGRQVVDRVVAGVHRPGQPAVTNAGGDVEVAVEDAAIGFTVPGEPGALSWLVLPTQAGDRPERWTLTRSGRERRLESASAGGGPLLWWEFTMGTHVPLRDLGEVAPPLTFTLRMSDIGRCPIGVMSVAHYLPSGECAHAEPVCPTCAGVGWVRDGDVAVVCGPGRGVASQAPVCGGTGRWSGTRAR